MVFRSNTTRLIDTRGSREERQLVARWRREIDSFLAVFGEDLLSGRCLLAFELSGQLELGLTVRPAMSPCPTLALKARRWLQEPIRTLAEQAATSNVGCQLSLHVSPERCRYTLHLDNPVAGGLPLQRHYGYSPPPTPPSAIHSCLLGDDISYWLSSKRAPHLAGLLTATRTSLESRFHISLGTYPAEMIEQHTWRGDQGWGLVRYGLALYGLPPEVSTRLLSGSGLRHFRYLAPYRAYRLLAVGFDRSGHIEKYVLLP